MQAAWENPMDGAKCQQPGCDGVIEGGFCNRCGLEPAGGTATAVAAEPAPSSTRGSFGSSLSGRSGSVVSGRTGTGRSSSRKHLGLGLVSIPELPQLDPAQVVMAEPRIPENKRFCSNPDCHDAQGNSTPLARREAGHCPQCGKRYSFVPTLKAGDVVAEQYEVKGCLAYGGFGWIYLAQDNTLGRWVVLKGLLNTEDESAAAAAVAERQFLAAVKHPNIVGIYNFVKRDAEGFIVMEYVGGTTLKKLRKDRGALPPAEAIAYMHRILGAFGYLHHLGIVYCDFKPDNMMLEGDPPDVKLIDMGGVRRIDDPGGDIYGTRGYSAPEAGEGPTVASDLFTVGRTLAVLLMDFRFQSLFEFTLPQPNEQEVLARHESLYRFLLKATAKDAARRFQSADEMADQLAGVLREVVAGTVPPRPTESVLFGNDVLALHEGDGEDLGVNRTSPALLPALKVNPDDPAAGFVLSTAAAATSPAKEAVLLREALYRYRDSTELPFRLVHALIGSGTFDEAEQHLVKLEAKDPLDWRVTWYRGVALLWRQNPREAVTAFDRIYSELPGELAVKLVLAIAAELAGDTATAVRLYDVVARTDPGFTTAAFGLARCLANNGKRHEAAEAYRLVAQTSSLYTRAQMALARALIRTTPSKPGAEELTKASAVLEALALEGMEQARLHAEVLENALGLLAEKVVQANPTMRVLGQSLEEAPLRHGLEEALRQMAHLETDRTKKIELVDRANRVRPVTWV
jgi:serine/threonine-protein kinase PknG